MPPLSGFDSLYRRDADAALALAHEHAWLMASEIRATGVDLSFAPVIDLERGNRAIGNRAFSPDPQVVAAFARAYVAGMHEAGMAATLKHFPGHGSIVEDTHFDVAVDDRSLEEMRANDLVPFAAGIAAGADAVMMAHVTYPQIAPEPAGYSPRWIGDILRGEMRFPRRGVLRRHRHGRGAFGRRHQGARWKRTSTPAATWCWSAIRRWSRMRCARSSRTSNTMALAGLVGRGALGWDGLLADSRHGEARARMADVPGRGAGRRRDVRAINVGDVA